MITRTDYLQNPKELHNDYWGQFVTDYERELVAFKIGIDKLRASTDPHFNDIPLHKWDYVARYLHRKELAEGLQKCGDFLTDGGMVCVLKVAARQLIETVE